MIWTQKNSYNSPFSRLRGKRYEILNSEIIFYKIQHPFILRTQEICLYIYQPVHFEGDQPWDFFGRNDAKAETPVLWPPHAKS